MDITMSNLCNIINNQLHIYPSVYENIHCNVGEDKDSLVINEILDTLDGLLETTPVIEFHVHTGKMKLSQLPKYKKVVNIFIQIVSVKYTTTMLDKCYFYDVNRTMKLLIDMLKPVLPAIVKEKMVILQETDNDKDD